MLCFPCFSFSFSLYFFMLLPHCYIVSNVFGDVTYFVIPSHSGLSEQFQSIALDVQHCKHMITVPGNDPLDQFTPKEEGKLKTTPISVHTPVITVDECAHKCLTLDHCASFNFDYGATMSCELLASIRHFEESLHSVRLYLRYMTT